MRGENTPKRKVTSTGDRTHNHQVMSPIRSPLSHPAGADTVVSLTYINNNYIHSDGSTPVSGSIDMKGNTLNNVTDPVNPQEDDPIIPNPYVGNTYLVTFLIELDPL